MTGQLVIAELGAFRTVLSIATAPVDSEKIKLWSRSTISNALHRVGMSGFIKDVAERAWSDADAFADALASSETCIAVANPAREKAISALDALIAAVQDIKTAPPSKTN